MYIATMAGDRIISLHVSTFHFEVAFENAVGIDGHQNRYFIFKNTHFGSKTSLDFIFYSINIVLTKNSITFCPVPNPTTASYNASVVKIYNAKSSLVRFESKNILFFFDKRL
jgi:hypothetical protein